MQQAKSLHSTTTPVINMTGLCHAQHDPLRLLVGRSVWHADKGGPVS